MRRASLVLALVGAGLTGCGSDDPMGSPPSLTGSWSLIGFTEGGVPAATTGDAKFRTDGTFVIQGTITFPEEPPETVAVQGTYVMTGASVALTTSDGTDTWTLEFSGEQVVLAHAGPPPNTITLRHRS